MKRCFALSRWSLLLATRTNGTENSDRNGQTEKKVIEIPRKVFLFFRKISVGMNRCIYCPTGTTGFSIQMVSAPGLPDWSICKRNANIMVALYDGPSNAFKNGPCAIWNNEQEPVPLQICKMSDWIIMINGKIQ